MWNTVSLIGRRYGQLIVTEQAPSDGKGRRQWLCQCDCGKTAVVSTSNLTCGRVSSCGCRKRRDLTGMHIGTLTVLERSDRYGSRGQRQVPLWKCRCDCGEIVYRATDTLTNPSPNMCAACAKQYAIGRARKRAGFVDGTQISRIKNPTVTADNTSGMRGIYLDAKTGKYRARIKFQGKMHNLGTYAKREDAIAARRRGEEEIFGTYLEGRNENSYHKRQIET